VTHRLERFDTIVIGAGIIGCSIAASGGFGLAIAELVAERPPSFRLDEFRPNRLESADPFSPEFRARCAAARSRKVSG
jgi:4-methylaminobutanoate oxidase (formaldehyde-forming)